jgi:hypothetical protein
MRWLTGRRLSLAVLVIGIGAGVGGVAYATIPNDGVINTCYLRSGGTLRVIDASVTKCKTSETALSWNQAGQPGADGQDGEDGTDGTNGTNGVSGYEVVTAETTDVSVFTPNRLDLRATCPAGKKFLGGGWTFYLVPPGFAPQYTPAERVNANFSTNFDGIDEYYVTVIHPIPAGNGAQLTVRITCATMAS